MKKAKTPTLPADLMSAFYAEASAFYEAAPWKHCSDADVFGVLVPESETNRAVRLLHDRFGLAEVE